MVTVESASPMIIDNIIRDNANDAVRITSSCSAVIRNNFIFRSYDTGIETDGFALIEDNTLVGSGTNIRLRTPGVIMRNNIISGGVAGIDLFSNYYESTILYNDIWGNGTNVVAGIQAQLEWDFERLTDYLSEDPLFMDSSIDDYNIQATSPCLDTGDPNPYYNDEADETRSDMGAAIDLNGTPCPPSPSVTSTPSVTPTPTPSP